MYDFSMAYLNEIQQKWFEEHVRDYKHWVDFTARRIIVQVSPEAGVLAFQIHGKEKVVSFYIMSNGEKVWQPRTRAESQEQLQFTFSPEIPVLSNQLFPKMKLIINDIYGY